MDDLDDKTGSEWLYIRQPEEKYLRYAERISRLLRNDLDNLSDPESAVFRPMLFTAISN